MREYAALVQYVDAGTSIDVLARDGNYAWVDVGTRRPTWIRTPERPVQEGRALTSEQ